MKRKIFALGLASAILSMTTACSTARNNGADTGTMAEYGTEQETNAVTNTNYDNNGNGRGNVMNTNNRNDYSTYPATEADNINNSDNGVIMDDTDGVVGGAVKDAADGISNAVNDVTDGVSETGMSSTRTAR